MIRDRSVPKSFVWNRSLGTFAGVAILGWVLVEVSLRWGLVSVLSDSFGSALGTDMVVVAIGFPLVAAGIAWWGSRLGITSSEWNYTVSLRSVAAGIGGIVAYTVVLFVVVLLAARMGIGLPSTDGVLGVSEAPLWALGGLLIVNCLLVPIVEEFAWRGVLQTALMQSYGTVIGGLITATAFVLKHVIVDAGEPWTRMIALVVLALLFSGLRARYGTVSSTVTHIGVNTISTVPLVITVL